MCNISTCPTRTRKCQLALWQLRDCECVYASPFLGNLWHRHTVKVIAAFDGWNAEVSQWKSELDRFELPGHAKMLLTCFGLFARVYINQGGLEDPILVENPRRWVYGTAAAQAAHDMLEVAQLEPFCSGLPLFPPIYIQVYPYFALLLNLTLLIHLLNRWSLYPLQCY